MPLWFALGMKTFLLKRMAKRKNRAFANAAIGYFCPWRGRHAAVRGIASLRAGGFADTNGRCDGGADCDQWQPTEDWNGQQAGGNHSHGWSTLLVKKISHLITDPFSGKGHVSDGPSGWTLRPRLEFRQTVTLIDAKSTPAGNSRVGEGQQRHPGHRYTAGCITIPKLKITAEPATLSVRIAK